MQPKPAKMLCWSEGERDGKRMKSYRNRDVKMSAWQEQCQGADVLSSQRVREHLKAR